MAGKNFVNYRRKFSFKKCHCVSVVLANGEYDRVEKTIDVKSIKNFRVLEIIIMMAKTGMTSEIQTHYGNQ